MMQDKLKIIILACLFIIVFSPCSYSFSTTYYVSNDGIDNNSGTSYRYPWKSIKKLNSYKFRPGDTVLLRRGNIFYEQLTVPTSGVVGKPITYGSYGEGEAPLISAFKGTNKYLEKYFHKDGICIYRIATKYTVRIVTLNGKLCERKKWVKDGLTSLINDNSFAYNTSEKYLYIRYDSKPITSESVRIGFLANGVLIDGKSYINISNINVEGANGTSFLTGGGIRISGHSNNIKISNVKVQLCSASGILVSASDHVEIDNAEVWNNLNNGLSVSIETISGMDYGCNNIMIRRVKSHHNGNVMLGGDRGGISIGTLGPTNASHSNVTVEYSQSYRNGGYSHAGVACDYGIHFWKTNSPLVRYCYVHHNETGGIKFETGCENARAYYNVVANNGLSRTYSYTLGGIFIGPNAQYAQIYNNVITNNTFNKNNHANAGITFGNDVWDATGIIIKNNIISNNYGYAEFQSPRGLNMRGIQITSNCWYRDNKDIIMWNGVMSILNVRDKEAVFYEPGFIMQGFFQKPKSQCLGKGVDVGMEEEYWSYAWNNSN